MFKKLIGDKFLQLAKGDLVKGFIMAILTSVATAVYQQLNGTEAHLPTVVELIVIGKAALSVGILYLIKNLFTNSDGKIGKEVKPPTE